MKTHRTRIVACIASVILTVAAIAPAQAHFLLNLNVRIFHIEHRADRLDVYVRLPMPYLVADKTGDLRDDGLPEPAPYTTNAMEGERLVHFVDFSAVDTDPTGLAAILAAGTRLAIDDNPLAATVEAVRVHALGSEPGFATLDEALAVFDAEAVYPEFDRRVYVGNAVVDVKLSYATEAAVSHYSLSSTLDPVLPNQDATANLVLDYGPGGTQIFRARGLLAEPIMVSRSARAAFATFVMEGIRHILEGIDHVLFVLCLLAGALTMRGLVSRVTGFTLGHSITLSAGFFGYVPSADWFVPAVETAIALSIIYAAAIAIVPRFRTATGEFTTFFVTSFIGLIHGLGFSFVLQNILKVSSPNIWQSLLAFNVGIEIGQLLIVLIAAALLWFAGRIDARAPQVGRVGLASVSGLIACYWAFERTGMLIAAV